MVMDYVVCTEAILALKTGFMEIIVDILRNS